MGHKIIETAIKFEDGTFEIGYHFVWETGVKFNREVLKRLYKEVKQKSKGDYGYWSSTFGSGVYTRVPEESVLDSHRKVSRDTHELSYQQI